MKREFNYSKKDAQWFPTINVVLQGPKRRRAFKALVDTGASFSVFRSEVADYLGIPIERGGGNLSYRDWRKNLGISS